MAEPYHSDEGSGSNSGSGDSGDEGSRGSGSAPGSPGSAHSGWGSHASGSYQGSPAGSGGGSGPGSPAGSGTPVHSGSGSPGSPAGSGSPGSPAGSGSEAGSHRSRSGSPRSHRSGSGSPGSHHSGSGSPASHRSHSGSPGSQGSRSRSGSPGSHHSGSGSPGSHRSRSGTPGSHRSGSPAGSHRSGSPAGSHHSGSGAGSPARSGSRSPSGSRGSRSRSGTPRSRSGSEAGSRQGSPARSGSPGSHRSRSGSEAGSPRSRKSGSGSPPGSRAGSGSEGGSPVAQSKRRTGLTDTEGSGSEDEIDKAARKKKTLITSDGEDEGSNKGDGSDKDATMGDLFGDADDISSDENEAKKMDELPDIDGEGEPRQVGMEEGEEQPEEEQEPPETRIEVEIPRITTNLGNMVHLVKLPNFLSVETRPFDPTTYEDEVDEDEVLDEEGRARLKLKVENTIRWRKKLHEDGTEIIDDYGEPMRESNARMVRWSDGSMSLHLGDEVFDVYSAGLQGDYNHLFIRQGTGLQGMSVFRTKLSFRPHSTDSFTHRKMTLSLADRTTKTQKVKVVPVTGPDPESHRSVMIKKEEEKLRASIRRETQQRRQKDRASARGPGYLDGGAYDEDDDGEGVSIAAIKRQYKQGGPRRPGERSTYAADIYSSDSEDESETDTWPQKRAGKKRLDIYSDEGSDDSDAGPKKKVAKIMDSDEEGREEESSPEREERDEDDDRGGDDDDESDD